MVSYGVFWIALTLAPVMNLTGVGQNVFAERYLYLPSVGFVWMAGLAWAWLRTAAPPVAWPAAAAILLACSASGNGAQCGLERRLHAAAGDAETIPGIGLPAQPDGPAVWIERDQFRRALDEQRWQCATSPAP